MHLRPFGPHALLAEVADASAALALATWARTVGIAAGEVVPAARTVLFDGLATAAVEDLRDRLLTWTPDAVAPDIAPDIVAGRPVGPVGPVGPVVEVPVVYDGADLAYIAEQWGTDVEGVVARHIGTAFTSAFCGFAPGFAYLAGLPSEPAVPRLDSPRAAVPAGAVALAGSWCGVYPTASPGGWRLLGRTDVVLWDATRTDPALLPPGTRVRFVRA
ncbi:allophanate hydrolase [Nocardioides psychrotolerans]|uniref:5-oxoprolinase subunit B family protein n=1 Tax=Nocardioides psychrotolerans TaxID=1005945 RepID=UPI001193EAE5|nr:carboxyltransferase domain-containing protein [Nocardioides psychrotolerans]GEP37237.1 allophanate hydrolase [Nocardioides psychrotolerans]